MKNYRRTNFNILNAMYVNIDRELLYSLRAYYGYEHTRKMFTARGITPQFKEHFRKQ